MSRYILKYEVYRIEADEYGTRYAVPDDWIVERLTAERDEARTWARRMKEERDKLDRKAYGLMWENYTMLNEIAKLREGRDYFRAQFNAAMAEIEARNQAEYAATIGPNVDNPPPFSPAMEED